VVDHFAGSYASVMPGFYSVMPGFYKALALQHCEMRLKLIPKPFILVAVREKKQGPCAFPNQACGLGFS
jgi:hypothetical protein